MLPFSVNGLRGAHIAQIAGQVSLMTKWRGLVLLARGEMASVSSAVACARNRPMSVS